MSWSVKCVESDHGRTLLSGSGMRVPGDHIPEQIYSRDQLVPILSFIKLNLNFCGGQFMDCRARSPIVFVMECPGSPVLKS